MLSEHTLNGFGFNLGYASGAAAYDCCFVSWYGYLQIDMRYGMIGSLYQGCGAYAWFRRW